MTAPRIGGEKPFIIETPSITDGAMEYYNGNTGERITAAEAEALRNGVAGAPDPVGDVAPKRTPQAGERVKIVKKDTRGNGKSPHYYVTDELGNQYEVDKKTYNSLKKGKGFVDGGQLKPISEGAPQPIKKPVDVLKGEQSQARREVRSAGAEAEKAMTEQERLKAEKAKLKPEYDKAKREMQEAKKALTEAIKKPGADVEKASIDYKNAKSNFTKISKDYKSVMTKLNLALGRTKRAVIKLDNAKTRATEITQRRNAEQAAKRQAAAEAEARRQARHEARTGKPTAPEGKPTAPQGEPVVPKVEPAVTEVRPAAAEGVAAGEGAVSRTATGAERTVTATEEAASKIKGGGKWGKILKWGLLAATALGIGTLAYVNNKDDDEVVTTESGNTPDETGTTGEVTVSEEGDDPVAPEGTTDTEEGGGVGAADEAEEEEPTVPATPSTEELEAEEAENNQDLEDIDAADAEFSQPITVKKGDNLWNICKEDLKRQNGADPTNAQIAEAVGKIMQKNLGTLRYELDGSTVLIYPRDTFDEDGTYHRN